MQTINYLPDSTDSLSAKIMDNIVKLNLILRRLIPPAVRAFYNESYAYIQTQAQRLPWLLDTIVRPILTKQELLRIARDSEHVLVGPWLSEVGFEVLYWIPFLNWIRDELGLSKERITVISRGGVAPWYADICRNYIDIFDYATPEEFKNKNEQRIAHTGGQKHLVISNFDMEILKRVRKDVKSNGFPLIHPVLMYKLFMPYWLNLHSMNLVARHSRYQSLPPVEVVQCIRKLPSEYAAVKFYFSDCFPDTAKNRDFINAILTRLTERTNVVLLNTNINIDDHSDYIQAANGRIFSIEGFVSPRNNLHLQTSIVSGARAFLGTYGGFSYLAPFYGVPSITFYSHKNFIPMHMEVARHAFSSLGRDSFTVFDTKDIDPMERIFI